MLIIDYDLTKIYFQKVIEIWEIMKYMTDIPPFPRTDDAVKVRYSTPVINALVRQGKKYLEDRYNKLKHPNRNYKPNVLDIKLT